MEMRSAADLKHNPTWGEVDPRTYPLLTCIRFACATVGDTQRTFQANQLVYAIDRISSQEGESRVRVHLTAKPGVDPKDAVEVHLQTLTSLTGEQQVSYVERMRKRLAELGAAGARAGWSLVT